MREISPEVCYQLDKELQLYYILALHCVQILSHLSRVKKRRRMLPKLEIRHEVGSATPRLLRWRVISLPFAREGHSSSSASCFLRVTFSCDFFFCCNRSKFLVLFGLRVLEWVASVAAAQILSSGIAANFFEYWNWSAASAAAIWSAAANFGL